MGDNYLHSQVGLLQARLGRGLLGERTVALLRNTGGLLTISFEVKKGSPFLTKGEKKLIY